METLNSGSVPQLNAELGNMDLYLLDQVLKGRFSPEMRILDAGCGEGRNLVWFIRQGFDVFACDVADAPLQLLRYQMRSLGRPELTEQVYTMDLEQMLFPDQAFDLVICSAVLHFSRDEEHFQAMLHELKRVCKPGAYLFIRAATTLGMEFYGLKPNSKGWYSLPDGSERFLLTPQHLEAMARDWTWVEPVKTVLIPGQRSMLSLMAHRK
jgi:ubiquinone/menaquinone biosynthesis C-methylase UbiE